MTECASFPQYRISLSHTLLTCTFLLTMAPFSRNHYIWPLRAKLPPPLLLWCKLALRLLFLVNSTLPLVSLISKGNICTVHGGYSSGPRSLVNMNVETGTKIITTMWWWSDFRIGNILEGYSFNSPFPSFQYLPFKNTSNEFNCILKPNIHHCRSLFKPNTRLSCNTIICLDVFVLLWNSQPLPHLFVINNIFLERCLQAIVMILCPPQTSAHHPPSLPLPSHILSLQMGDGSRAFQTPLPQIQRMLTIFSPTNSFF